MKNSLKNKSKNNSFWQNYMNTNVLKITLLFILAGVLSTPFGLALDTTPPKIVSFLGSGSPIENVGYRFSDDTDLVLGTNLYSVNPVLNDTELPNLLTSGTIEANDGSVYNYTQKIILPNNGFVSADINSYSSISDFATTPLVVYYDFNGASFYQTEVDFTNKWNAEDFLNSETIDLFGDSYIFNPHNENADNILTLYGSDAQAYVEENETFILQHNGDNYTIVVLGGNSENLSAIIRINNATESVEEGDFKTIGGLPVYIRDIFTSDVPPESVAVQLFVIDNKIELNADDGTIKTNDALLDEVTFTVNKTGSNDWENITKLTFTVTPSNGENAFDYLSFSLEEFYLDPLFRSFMFYFNAPTNLTNSKEELRFIRSNNKVQVKFVPQNGTAFTLDVAQNQALSDGFIGGASLDELIEDNIFIYNDVSDPDQVVTHVLKITNLHRANNIPNPDFEVRVNDLTFNRAYTLDGCETISSDILLYPQQGATADTIDFTTDGANSCTAGGALSGGGKFLYTKAGARISMNLENLSGIVFGVDEDYQNDAETSTALDNITLSAIYDVADDEYDLSMTEEELTALDNEDNADYYLSQFGTYIVEETDNSGAYVSMYVPPTEATYNMLVGPTPYEDAAVLYVPSPYAMTHNSNVMLIIPTNENATCKYDLIDTTYDFMENAFTTNGEIVHIEELTLTDGDYVYYVRCMDESSNVMTNSYVLSFSVNTSSDLYAFVMPDSSSGFTSARFGKIISNYELTDISGWSTLSLDEFLNSSASDQRLTTNDVNAVYIYDSAADEWTTYATPFTDWNFDGHSTDFIGYYVFSLKNSAAGKFIRHN